jgi:hypothetical protein
MSLWYSGAIWEAVHMVFLYHTCHYGTLMPFGKLFIWYLGTVQASMVLSSIWEAVHMVFCHYRGHYGTFVPFDWLLIWYFFTIHVCDPHHYHNFLFCTCTSRCSQICACATCYGRAALPSMPLENSCWRWVFGWYYNSLHLAIMHIVGGHFFAAPNSLLRV